MEAYLIGEERHIRKIRLRVGILCDEFWCLGKERHGAAVNFQGYVVPLSHLHAVAEQSVASNISASVRAVFQHHFGCRSVEARHGRNYFR